MEIIILETDAKTFFSRAEQVENTCPDGHWKYCKFLNKNSVIGIFENKNSFEGSQPAHPDFFKFFLGLFSPKLKEKFELHQESNFKAFCSKLNELLNDDKDIYDLSVSQKWIWSEGERTKIPKKLLAFIDFE